MLLLLLGFSQLLLLLLLLLELALPLCAGINSSFFVWGFPPVLSMLKLLLMLLLCCRFAALAAAFACIVELLLLLLASLRLVKALTAMVLALLLGVLGLAFWAGPMPVLIYTIPCVLSSSALWYDSKTLCRSSASC